MRKTTHAYVHERADGCPQDSGVDKEHDVYGLGHSASEKPVHENGSRDRSIERLHLSSHRNRDDPIRGRPHRGGDPRPFVADCEVRPLKLPQLNDQVRTPEGIGIVQGWHLVDIDYLAAYIVRLITGEVIKVEVREVRKA